MTGPVILGVTIAAIAVSAVLARTRLWWFPGAALLGGSAEVAREVATSPQSHDAAGALDSIGHSIGGAIMFGLFVVGCLALVLCNSVRRTFLERRANAHAIPPARVVD